MKYRLINPEVFATQITNENRSHFATPGDPDAKVGDFAVTFSDGHLEMMPKDTFLKKYKPALLDDAKREMYRLASAIIDKESLVDDSNAENLLAEACDLARALRKLIQ
jgi:hypothetical protein